LADTLLSHIIQTQFVAVTENLSKFEVIIIISRKQKQIADKFTQLPDSCWHLFSGGLS